MKKQIALNKLWCLYCFLMPVVAFIAYCCFSGDEKEIGWGSFFLILSLMCLFVMVITPCIYIFDSEGITLWYLFIPRERYLWKNISEIEVNYEASTTGRSELYDFLFSTKFCINGYPEGKLRFYMKGEVVKSFRTKRLLEKYWDGTISGYWDEDIKKWWRRRKKKKAQESALQDRHIADEVAPMERDTRARVRELLEPLQTKAEKMGLEIRTKYLYVTKEGETSRSRPKKEGYKYTAVLGICHIGEKDDSRVVEVGADLLHVRLGRKAYRGVMNQEFTQELGGYVNDVLENGIETYCEKV